LTFIKFPFDKPHVVVHPVSFSLQGILKHTIGL
jgi:hypothetical protein